MLKIAAALLTAKVFNGPFTVGGMTLDAASKMRGVVRKKEGDQIFRARVRRGTLVTNLTFPFPGHEFFS